MTSQTFQLQTQNGKLVIPVHIQDYLSHCSDTVKISLIIESQELNDNPLLPSSDDPDQGKEIKESFHHSLLEIQQRRSAGRPTITEKEVYQRYGIS